MTLWLVGVQVAEPLATLGAWATFALAAWSLYRGQTWKALTPYWPLGLAAAWCLIVPAAFGKTPTGTGVARTLDWLLIPAAAWAASALTSSQWVSSLRAAAVTALLTSAVAACQAFGFWPSAEFFAPYAWTKIPFERVYELAPGTDSQFLAGGLLFHRLRLANVAAVIAVLLAAAPILRGRILRFGAAAASVVGIAVFAQARAAAVAVLVVLGVVVGMRMKSAVRALGVLAAGLFAVALVFALNDSARERFSRMTSNDEPSSRMALALAGLSAVASAPFTGVGLGAFHASDFASEDAPEEVRTHKGKAHNQFLTLAAEAGAPGLSLTLAAFGVAVAQYWKRRRVDATGLSVAMLFVLLGVLHDPLFHPEPSLALVLGLGVGLRKSDAFSA